jgi:hypothetical protein
MRFRLMFGSVLSFNWRVEVVANWGDIKSGPGRYSKKSGTECVLGTLKNERDRIGTGYELHKVRV